MTLADALSRTLVGSAVASLLLSSTACGSSETTEPTPDLSASTSTSASTAPATPALTQGRLRQAFRRLVEADTGRSTVRVGEQPTDDRATVAVLPRVDGEWSFEERASRTVATSESSDTGPLTLTTVVIERQAYAQALYDGSAFEPDCWLAPTTRASWLPTAVVPVVYSRPLTASGSQGENVTMRAADVLTALGFQKLVSGSGTQLSDLRVDATVRIDGDTLTGWTVAADALAEALGPIDPGLFSAYTGTTWEVSVQDLGGEVTVSAPDPDRVLDIGESCT